MNYRILFFISVLVLLVGLGGLFMLPTESEPQANTTESTSPQTTAQEKKNIKLAMASKSLSAGSILKPEDYQINELQIEVTSSLADEDISELLLQNTTGLDGFLLSEHAASGHFLAKSSLISPSDERFLFYTVGKDEVVFRVYIRLENQFVLDTLKSGDIVGLFAQQQDFSRNAEQQRFDEILQNLEVVKIDRFDKDKDANREEAKDYAGYVSVRMKANLVKEIFSLTKNRSLLVLPQGELVDSKTLNKRGLSVRSLRGRN
ncbi:hypothetical protein BMT54_07615 [Pasteurellaceae bacterium 15-036681]|nr:hypothetical protein BMT54_07615 [Pasteurellaceae bacterium 15-036681]